MCQTWPTSTNIARVFSWSAARERDEMLELYDRKLSCLQAAVQFLHPSLRSSLYTGMFVTAKIEISSARMAYVSTIAGNSIALPN